MKIKCNNRISTAYLCDYQEICNFSIVCKGNGFGFQLVMHAKWDVRFSGMQFSGIDCSIYYYRSIYINLGSSMTWYIICSWQSFWHSSSFVINCVKMQWLLVNEIFTPPLPLLSYCNTLLSVSLSVYQSNCWINVC